MIYCQELDKIEPFHIYTLHKYYCLLTMYENHFVQNKFPAFHAFIQFIPFPSIDEVASMLIYTYRTSYYSFGTTFDLLLSAKSCFPERVIKDTDSLLNKADAVELKRLYCKHSANYIFSTIF